MKKLIVAIAILITTFVIANVSQSEATMYYGTYSGDDSGTWFMSKPFDNNYNSSRIDFISKNNTLLNVSRVVDDEYKMDLRFTNSSRLIVEIDIYGKVTGQTKDINADLPHDYSISIKGSKMFFKNAYKYVGFYKVQTDDNQDVTFKVYDTGRIIINDGRGWGFIREDGTILGCIYYYGTVFSGTLNSGIFYNSEFSDQGVYYSEDIDPELIVADSNADGGYIVLGKEDGDSNGCFISIMGGL